MASMNDLDSEMSIKVDKSDVGKSILIRSAWSFGQTDTSSFHQYEYPDWHLSFLSS